MDSASLSCASARTSRVSAGSKRHSGSSTSFTKTYRYFVLSGHLRIDGEEILEQNDRYDVVSKEAL